MLRKRKREVPSRRRYAGYTPGGESPSPPSPGSASIRLTVSVDVEAWAQARGKTVEEAERELGRRIDEATSPIRDRLAAELGDMREVIQSMTVSTGR